MNAEVIYVTENGVGDGMSWNSAAPLADALSWAAKGDEIYVAKGTYTGSFALKVVTVRGLKPNRLHILRPKVLKLF